MLKAVALGIGLFISATSRASWYDHVKSWKDLRDHQVVKQNWDYSCGAASLATVLNEFYGQNLREMDVLKALDNGTGRANFEDMSHALAQFGFKGEGFAATYEQLTNLKVPVIVYLKHRRDDHFSVLRGASHDTVWLADPSLGNRTYSRVQFLDMWQTRHDETEEAGLQGRILVILPAKSNVKISWDFFTSKPRRQTERALEQMSTRRER